MSNFFFFLLLLRQSIIELAHENDLLLDSVDCNFDPTPLNAEWQLLNELLEPEPESVPFRSVLVDAHRVRVH